MTTPDPRITADVVKNASKHLLATIPFVHFIPDDAVIGALTKALAQIDRERGEVSEDEAMQGGRWINADDVDALVLRLDVALNGPGGATRPKLCDLVGHEERKVRDRPEPAEEVLEAIAAERRRQVEVEGWTSEHDDSHAAGDLAPAAATYAYASVYPPTFSVPSTWPWAEDWWKPSGRRRMLIKAGALILAEIERLDRIALKSPPHG